LILAALFGASGVSLGAYAAHGMENHLRDAGLPAAVTQRRVESAQIAVRYQLVHAVALLALAGMPASFRSRWTTASQWLFVLGMILFCGGLSLIALSGHVGHWAIVPAGGLSLILAWLLLAAHAIWGRAPSAAGEEA
jgi:uncharacterized membrane protein YgdD (TMEM256/DUF423 family)